MDLANVPAWVYYGITGAIVGAVLAAIGYGLQKAGFGWGRFIVVLTFALTGPLTERVVRPMLTQLMWSDTQTETALLKEMPLLLPYLKTSFPDDYTKIVSSATALVRSAPASGPAPGKMAEVVAAIRKKYAPFVKFADDTSLAALLNQSIDFHQQVFDTSGAALCGRVAMEGAAALSETGAFGQYASMIDEQSRSVFQAARSGIDHPVTRAEPSDADWGAIGQVMIDMGASADDFTVLQAGDAGNPRTCPVLIMFMRAMNADGVPGAARASFLSDASGS